MHWGTKKYNGSIYRFGSPYTIQVSREVLYQDLQKLLMKEMASILHDDILISHQKVPLFKIRVVDGLEGANYLDAEVDLPMYTEAIEQTIGLCSIDQVVPHVKLVLEWDAPAKSQIIAGIFLSILSLILRLTSFSPPRWPRYHWRAFKCQTSREKSNWSFNSHFRRMFQFVHQSWKANGRRQVALSPVQ